MNWLLWRPVLAGVATLTEVSVQWSCEELAACHRAMDAKDAIQAHIAKTLTKGVGK